MTVYVCFDKDIECGDRPGGWCLGCPKRGLLQVAVAPHAAAGPYPTAMRPATPVEAEAIARRFRGGPLMDPQRVRELAAADIEAAYQRGKRAGYSEGFRAGKAGVMGTVPASADILGRLADLANTSQDLKGDLWKLIYELRTDGVSASDGKGFGAKTPIPSPMDSEREG